MVPLILTVIIHQPWSSFSIPKIINLIYVLFLTKSLLLYVLALVGLWWVVATYWKLLAFITICGVAYLGARVGGALNG